MEKVVYHFINNSDYPEIIFSSTDESLIQECICDSFMADVWYEFNSLLDSLKPTEAAKEAWNEVLNWYKLYIYIVKSRFI